jgi:hypothetical protein
VRLPGAVRQGKTQTVMLMILALCGKGQRCSAIFLIGSGSPVYHITDSLALCTAYVGYDGRALGARVAKGVT